MKIAICGILGKMGREIVKVAYEKKIKIVAGIEKEEFKNESPKKIFNIEYDFPILSAPEDLDKIQEKPDIIVDFSQPGVIIPFIEHCTKNNLKIGFVIGTTGFSKEQEEKIKELSEKTPIFMSSNMSRGINLLLKILPEIKKNLPDFDVEIVEIHHRMKKDSPSGTALKLADVLGGKRVFGREGIAGPRQKDEIGVFAVRGGDVVGDHTVFFLGDGERIEITHRASSRRVFAIGAIKAAEMIYEKLKEGKKGLFSSMF